MVQQLLPEYVNCERSTPGIEDRIVALEQEIAGLKQQIKALNHENLLVIWRLLSPLYKSLQPIFGEMEAGGVVESPSASPGKNAKWDAVKQRLAPRLREAIDILQMQGTMKRTQLASALKMDYSNCTKNVIGVLVRQGWIVVNGGVLSLKEL